jgi:hypothetical protein
MLEHVDDGALAEPISSADGWSTPPGKRGHRIVFDRAPHAVDS